MNVMTCLLVWPRLGPVLRLLGLLALCVSLTACANLQGLREYAKSSQQLADGPGLVQRWQQSDEVLRARQAMFDVPILPRRTPEAQALVQSQGRQIQEIQRALAAYFKTVGELSADGLPSLDQEVARLGEAWDELDPAFEAADRQALKALGRVLSQPLQGHRHRAVHQLVQSQHPAVDRLLARLQALSAMMAQDLQAEADAARVPYLQLLGQTSQPALRFLVRERMEAQRAGHDQPMQEAWRQYQSALGAVRRAHARLAQVDDLAQWQAQAQALGEAVDSVRAFQAAWATVRPH